MAYFDPDKKPLPIDISFKTILRVLLVIAVIYFAYLIGDVLAILFVSLILASLITPWADWLQKRRIPRGVGVLAIYAILLGVAGLFVYLLIPPITEQVNQFSKNSPVYLEKLFSGVDIFLEKAKTEGVLDNLQKSLSDFSSGLSGLSGGVFSTVSSILGGMASLIFILVITFYMVAEENGMKKVIWSIVPEKHQPYVIQLFSRMQKKTALWLRGQIILSLIIFVFTYTGLLILGVEYPLVLALLAGITEFIPYLGPIIAAVPAIFVAFTQSPLLALFVLILYYVVQLVESNIIVPKLMHKMVGLNPIVIIVVLLIGFKLYGVVGAILAIPVATAANVFWGDISKKRKELES